MVRRCAWPGELWGRTSELSWLAWLRKAGPRLHSHMHGFYACIKSHEEEARKC